MADIDFLAVHAEGSPHKPALILGERSVDFATLNRRANKAAHVFTELGCEAQDRVAIMSFNSIQGFEISNGLRRVKLIAVPVNYRLRGSEVADLLNDSGASVVCADDHHVDILEAALHQLLGEMDVIQPKVEADGAHDLIESHRVTTAFMAPTLLQRLVDAQERRPRDLSSLRALILGAAPCPQALKVRAEAVLGQVIWEFYGATETGLNTVLRPEDQLRKPGSCGPAVPGQEIRP